MGGTTQIMGEMNFVWEGDYCSTIALPWLGKPPPTLSRWRKLVTLNMVDFNSWTVHLKIYWPDSRRQSGTKVNEWPCQWLETLSMNVNVNDSKLCSARAPKFCRMPRTLQRLNSILTPWTPRPIQIYVGSNAIFAARGPLRSLTWNDNEYFGLVSVPALLSSGTVVMQNKLTSTVDTEIIYLNKHLLVESRCQSESQ